MFDMIPTAPPDPILGLTEAFAADPNPHKINLGVGVYQDSQGQTPVMACVLEAQKQILAAEKTKNYRPITGDPDYGRHTQSLILKADHPIIAQNRIMTAHCPGGTGALRVAADYLAKLHRGTTVWLSDPTWANHEGIFKAAGLPTETYPYFDATNMSLSFDEMIEGMDSMSRGDVMLLHGCCHNPTGVDLSGTQWRSLAEKIRDVGVLPVIDLAYQGLADGLDPDVAGLRMLADLVPELMVCSSYSKNFGLYNERVGALSIIASSEKAVQAVFSQIKTVIRANYSNPPAHGGAIVKTVLDSNELRSLWQEELSAMRQRIKDMRKAFAGGLADRGVDLIPSGNDFLNKQNGMFSFSGLTKQQVGRLREEHSVYIVGSGRINVAGITSANIERLCDAVQDVVQS